MPTKPDWPGLTKAEIQSQIFIFCLFFNSSQLDFCCMVSPFIFTTGLCLFSNSFHLKIKASTQVIKGSQTQIDLFLKFFRKTRAERILFGLRKNTVALQMVPVFYMRALCRASGHCGCVFYSDDLQFIPSIEPNFSTIQMDALLCIVTTYYSINSTIANVQPWAPFARPAAPVWKS